MAPVILVALALALATAGCGRPSQSPAARVEEGRRLFGEGRHVEALAAFDLAIQADPAYGPAHVANAEAFARLGETRAALAEYVRAAELIPGDPVPHVRAGEILLGMRRFKDARDRATTALTISPGDVDAQILLGYAFAGMRDFDAALAELRTAIAIDPTRMRSYGLLADTAAAAGKLPEAEEALLKATQLAPDVARPEVSLAAFYWATGRQAEAEARARRAVAIDPTDLAANRMLALFLLALGRGPEAEPYLKQLAGELGDVDARLELADYYIGQDRLADAAAVLEELRSAPRTFITSRLRLATIAERERRYADARTHLRELFEVDPNNARALVIQGRLQFIDGNAGGAMASLQAAVAAEPQSSTVRLVLGTIYRRTGLDDEALDAFREAGRLDATSSAPFVQLARLFLDRRQPRDALLAARRSVEISPADPAARVTLIRCLVAVGDLKEAEQEIGALERVYPNAAEVVNARGHLDAAAGRTSAARRALRRAHALAPDEVAIARDLIEFEIAADALREADRLASALLAAAPDDADRLMLRARVQAARGDIEAARASMTRALTIRPETASMHAAWGGWLLASGRHDEALHEFESAARHQPQTAIYHYELGRAAMAAGNAARARVALARSLEISRTFEGASNAERLLATIG